MLDLKLLQVDISQEFLSLFQAEHRTMAVFILAVIVNSYNTGQVSLVHVFSYLDLCVFLYRCPFVCTERIICLLPPTITTAEPSL